MKPIKLKIKGLNSFIDKQEIDFERLTDKGLFGIFGPTGSGKSTVLDGITLALYGEVARKSSNYMNTNCDSLNVSYVFQISGKEIKKYRVEREFRRDSKTDSIRTRSAKIVDITGDEENILEEGAKSVTQKCEEIIGLGLADFTRTVVLPQGKFSEFLKLEGKDRRNMLERLFNLQKYGDELSLKLAGKIKEEKEKASILEGELKGYENISQEALDEKTKNLEETNEKCAKFQAELIEAEKNYTLAKELWDLQNELKEQLVKEKELKEKEQYIKDSQRKVKLGESALKIKPYIDSYENTLTQIKNTNIKLETMTNEMKKIKENREAVDGKLAVAKEKKDNELPVLKVKEEKIVDAIKERNVLIQLIKEKKVLEDNIEKMEDQLINVNSRICDSEKDIKNLNTKLTDSEKKVEELKISEEYKNKINEGIVFINNYDNLSKQKNSLSRNIEITTSSIEKAKNNSNDLSQKLEKQNEALIRSNEALEKLVIACPGDQNTLLAFQQKVSTIKDSWNKYKEYNDLLNKSKEIIINHNGQLQNLLKEKANLEETINEISNRIKKIETENIANTLRVELREGQACPVCGSNEHHKENLGIIEVQDLKELNLELEEKQDKNNKVSNKIVELQTNIKANKLNIGEMQNKINHLGEEFKTTSIEEVEKELIQLKKSIEKYNNDKTILENNIRSLTKDKNEIEIKLSTEITIINQKNDQLIGLKEELSRINGELEKINNQLLSLKSQLGIEDFIVAREEINKKENEKASLENIIKILRNKLKVEIEQKETLNNEAGKFREEIRENKATLVEKNKGILEKENSIKNKIGNIEDLDKLKKEISELIIKISDEYSEAEELKKEIERQFTDCSNNIISTQSNLATLKDRSIDDKENLDRIMKEEDFEDTEIVNSCYIEKPEIEELKLQIEKYRDSMSKLTGAIENLNKKIDNRTLTEEKWIDIQKNKNEKVQILKEIEESKIKLETELRDISDKLVKLKDLLKIKAELDYRLGLLNDLEKLFKGKRFVEYVAGNQLKYISIEACKRLKEITGGTYGLEVDENGRFLIRDYKNGGAQRDASTLSGGETFVTSLALALALSAQIQLKGTAPLELFFLDEGFGTLDDNLMEVVMDSLERIHNEKLSIGIISHVEAIKNRVPVKLLVTPAESGMGGSKVRIERT